MWAASLKNPSLSCIHVLSGNHSIQAPGMLFIRSISTGEEQDGPVGVSTAEIELLQRKDRSCSDLRRLSLWGLVRSACWACLGGHFQNI